METVNKNEFMKRAEEYAPKDPENSDLVEFFGCLVLPVVLLFVAGILFGASYLVSRGWHAGM